MERRHFAPDGFTIQWRELGVLWKCWGPTSSPAGLRAEIELRYVTDSLGLRQAAWKYINDNSQRLARDVPLLGEGLTREQVVLQSKRSVNTNKNKEFRITSGAISG